MSKSQEDIEFEKSSPGKLLKVLPFLTIVIILGGWSAGFYLLQLSHPGTVSDNVRCIIFFGGLLISVVLGALLGSFLKRVIWKALLKQVRRE
jgi:hypothetical protein